MAGYIADGGSEIDENMKWVLLQPQELLTREQLGYLIYDAGDLSDPRFPLYKRVPLDDPRPDATEMAEGDYAAHALG